MAVLNQFNVNDVSNATGQQVSPLVVEQVKESLGVFFWNWYKFHQEDKIITINFFIFSKTVRVKNIKEIFKLLFGDPPEELRV